MLTRNIPKSLLAYGEIKMHFSTLSRFMIDTRLNNTISKEFHSQGGNTLLVKCLVELSTWTFAVQSQFLKMLLDILFMVQVACLPML